MKWAAWVAKLNAKKIISLAIVITFVGGGLAWYFIHKNHQHSNAHLSISQQILNGSLADARKQVAQKNYALAQSNYVSAATQVLAEQGPAQAIDILQQAIKNIPEKNLTWQFYDNLAATAKSAGNKNLQISSLKKALAKAQLPNSGAPAGAADAYKQKLTRLEAKL